MVIKSFLKIDTPEKKYIKIQKNNSILSDVCEALIGAIFLDSNINEAKKFIQKYWKEKIYKNIYYVKNHDEAIKRVLQGSTDVAAISSINFEKWFKSNQKENKKIKEKIDSTIIEIEELINNLN